MVMCCRMSRTTGTSAVRTRLACDGPHRTAGRPLHEADDVGCQFVRHCLAQLPGGDVFRKAGPDAGTQVRVVCRVLVGFRFRDGGQDLAIKRCRAADKFRSPPVTVARLMPTRPHRSRSAGLRASRVTSYTMTASTSPLSARAIISPNPGRAVNPLADAPLSVNSAVTSQPRDAAAPRIRQAGA